MVDAFVCTAIIITFMQTFGIIVDWSVFCIVGFSDEKATKLVICATAKPDYDAKSLSLLNSRFKHLNDEFRINTHKKTTTEK